MNDSLRDEPVGQPLCCRTASPPPEDPLAAAIPPLNSCGAAPRPRRDCGPLDMRIARDGSWHYRGSPIGRKALVCLFASVLKREPDGRYWLETPVERGEVVVEDAPFIAVEMFWDRCAGRQCLSFRTNLDEMVTADAEHPIRVAIDPRTREPRPYITVRPGLEARINRAVFYELVALAEPETVEGQVLIGVWSQGVFFPIDEAPAEPPRKPARRIAARNAAAQDGMARSGAAR